MVETENFHKLRLQSCPLPPTLGTENLSDQWPKPLVKVTSKLFMDPTNAFASDPNVWLLTHFWCENA